MTEHKAPDTPVETSQLTYEDALRESYSLMELDPSSFDRILRLENALEAKADLMVRAINNITINGKPAGREEILSAKIFDLDDVNRSVAGIKQKLPEEYFDDFVEQYLGLFGFGRMNTRDYVFMDMAIKQHAPSVNKLENLHSEKATSVAHYKHREKRKEEVAGQLNGSLNRLGEWLACYYLSHDVLKAVARTANSEIESMVGTVKKADGSPDYDRIMDSVLDFVEAHHAPLGNSYPMPTFKEKQYYWGALSHLYHNEFRAEQMGEFACIVSKAVGEGYNMNLRNATDLGLMLTINPQIFTQGLQNMMSLISFGRGGNDAS